MEAVKTKKDVLGSLPPEIAQSISLYLKPESLDKALTCNKLWNKLLSRNYYWYKKCQARGYNELKDTSISPIYEKYLVRFRPYWQSFFNYNQLQYNWTNDIFTTTMIDSNSFYELNYFDDEVLIAADITQKQIFIFDSCTGQIKHIILRPKRIVKFVKYQNLLVFVMADNLYRGDKYLEVFTIEGESLFSKKLNKLITGNEYFMIRLQVYKTLIAIGNSEGPFYIIDFEKDTTYKNSKVCYVCFGDDVIALGKTNGTIEILDMKYESLKKFSHGVRRRINKIMISQDYMVTLAEHPRAPFDNHDMSVWNLKDEVLLYTVKKISIFDENYTCSIYQDKLTIIKDIHNRTKCKVLVLDLPTGNQIFDISTFSSEIRTVLSNGHYIFVTTTTQQSTGGTTSIHCSQSGKEITSINNIYDDVFLTDGCYPLRSTETKLAYITNKGDLFIRNYEKNIH